MIRSEIQQLSPMDIKKIIRKAVRAETGILRKQIDELIRELRMRDHVLNLSQVAKHFNGKVKPKTIKEYYIKGKRLPDGVCLPLPARKVGNLYFVRKEMLDKWRLGQVDVEDLYPWQKKKFADQKPQSG